MPASPAQRQAEQLLAVTGAVDIRRVPEGDAHIQRAVNGAHGLRVIHLSPASRLALRVGEGAADGPGAQAESAHFEAAAPQGAREHNQFLRILVVGL